jgi:hypothetical protein
VPRDTRGFYVLYDNVRPKTGRVKQADVTYIGISGLGKWSGIRSRLRRHNQRKADWHDSRVGLSNVQTGSSKFRQARKRALWSDMRSVKRAGTKRP